MSPDAEAPARRPLVIGIAGGSASGKSTVARRLAEMLCGLRVHVVGMDAYFRPDRPSMVAPLTGRSYRDDNHPDSFDLAGLRRDLDALCSQPEAPQVVLVEGLLVLADDALRARLDLGIYLDAPADERIVRRLRRNLGFGLSFDEIADFYLDSVRHRHQEYVEPSRWHADLVLNGSQTSERGLALVAEWIRGHAPSDGRAPAD